MSRTLGTPYLDSLLVPEYAFDSKYPGTADATIALHRKQTVNVTANAGGAVGVLWQPFFLANTSAGTNTFFVNNTLAYNGFNNLGTGTVSQSLDLQINSGTVGAYRLVSASMHIIPQSSVLNQAGSIHGAMYKANQSQPIASGSAFTSDVNALLYPNFQNTPYYNCASVSAMQGIRIIWVPNDQCFTEFTTLGAVPTSGDQQNSLVGVVVNAAASATFRVDLYANYEVVPITGSILSGMESICPYNRLGSLYWRDILLKHKHDIVRASSAVNEIVNIQDNNNDYRHLRDNDRVDPNDFPNPSSKMHFFSS
jgi:hypothetical protein